MKINQLILHNKHKSHGYKNKNWEELIDYEQSNTDRKISNFDNNLIKNNIYL